MLKAKKSKREEEEVGSELKTSTVFHVRVPHGELCRLLDNSPCHKMMQFTQFCFIQFPRSADIIPHSITYLVNQALKILGNYPELPGESAQTFR